MNRKSYFFIPLLTLALCLAGCGAASGDVAGHTAPTVTPNQLTVVDPMANELPAVSTNGAVYLTILNGMAQPVALVAAQSPIAAQVTFHETINDNGVMRMTQPEGGFVIGAGEALVFASGGKHLMLEQLQQPLQAGQAFSLTLTFDSAPPITVTVPILPIGKTEMDHSQMNH